MRPAAARGKSEPDTQGRAFRIDPGLRFGLGSRSGMQLGLRLRLQLGLGLEIAAVVSREFWWWLSLALWDWRPASFSPNRVTTQMLRSVACFAALEDNSAMPESNLRGWQAKLDESTAGALESDLRREIRGEVRFDRLMRTIYSTDASLYKIHPVGVVFPRDADDVRAAVHCCQSHGVPIVARGAGTGIAGGAVGWGLQLDFSKFMNRIGPISEDGRTVDVEPGVVLDDLNAAVAARGVFFPPDVATASRATIGGMIGNNSAGSHSVYYGRTVDYVESLTVVLADGSVATWQHHPYSDLPANEYCRTAQRPFFNFAESASGFAPLATDKSDPGTQVVGFSDRPGPHISLPQPCYASHSAITALPRESILSALEEIRRRYRTDILERFPRVLRRNGGYALDRLCLSRQINPATLVIGSEGTLALVVKARVRLAPLPRHKALIVLHFESVLDAVAATPRLLAHRPVAVELVDALILRAGLSQSAPDAFSAFLDGCPPAILICELYDDCTEQLQRRMSQLQSELTTDRIGQPAYPVFDLATQSSVWTLRNKGFGLLMSRPGDRHPYEFIEDAAVDPACLADYIADLDAMLQDEGVRETGYYAHASVGVIHVRPTLNLGDPTDVRRLRRIAEKTTNLVLRYGGAMTGEHGDGIVRSEFLERMYGPHIVQAFREVKRAFDPDGLLNPGKIVDPLSMDQRLRGAAGPRPLPVATHFDYAPHRDIRALAKMCSGVGACRQKRTGTMCPSYQATLDERHTTRARAIALQAALSDDGLLAGLDDPALDEVMDLCLMCKACKTECPTGVDMARLKAEWLHFRGARHGFGPAARFLADAPRFARWGAQFPTLANALTGSPRVRDWLQHRYGIDRRVAPPHFAEISFQRWWSRQRHARRGRRGTVVYFADTWTNAYWPPAGRAAVRLLEAAGFEVVVPALRCCGRPAISKGLLDRVVRDARWNLRILSDYARRGAWIVGNEPSCLLTFRDEIPALLNTEDARLVASRTRLVDELLAEIGWQSTGTLRPSMSENGVAATRRNVLVHGHCHQKALVGMQSAMSLLANSPCFEATEINSGCCGMAGSFGHEKSHYAVARAVGEQRLFPAIRSQPQAEIAVTGFSCREQIAHHTGVLARHVLEFAAELLPA